MNFDVMIERHELDEEAPGGMVINPHSALGKELRKWEQHYSDLTPRGTKPGNPYVYREYPKMLYRAQRLPNSQYACLVQMPDPYAYDRADLFQRDILAAETFNRSCTKVVKDDSEERIAKGQGWANSPTAAMEQYEREQQEIGNAAAEAAFAAQRMTAKAREEFAAAGETTHEHVVDVKGGKRGPKAVHPSADV